MNAVSAQWRMTAAWAWRKKMSEQPYFQDGDGPMVAKSLDDLMVSFEL